MQMSSKGKERAIKQQNYRHTQRKITYETICQVLIVNANGNNTVNLLIINATFVLSGS